MAHKYRMQAELERIAKEENRKITDADRERVNQMYLELENAVETKTITETQAIKAAMEVRFAELCTFLTISELVQIGYEYSRRCTGHGNEELRKTVGRNERKARATSWLYETHGIAPRHINLIMNNETDLRFNERKSKG